MNESIGFLSALEAIKRFETRELSPVELMQVVIDQSERVEPSINAFSHRFFDQAMDEAKASEQRYMTGQPMGPLDGLPVAIKDEQDVAGQPNTEGSLLYRKRIADEDSVLAARLRQAGAIFHARTTCPEFCSLWVTHSRLNGVTHNPWNLDITPGGSSGGSGASLAAGTSLLATGSDIGGSIRFPAAMCGLVGFKPPWGRVPETYRPFNMEMYCANGPMARTVADTALMQNIMSGYHPCDAASALQDVRLPLTYPDGLKGLRLAYSLDFGRFTVEPDVIQNTLAMVEQLRDLGAIVEEVNPGFPADIERAYYGHMAPLFYNAITETLDQHEAQLCDYNIVLSRQVLEPEFELMSFYDASNIESEMNAVFGELMEQFDAFICPTVFTTAMPANHNPVVDEYIVNDKAVASDLEISSCHLFNMMGRCPSISIPSGIAGNGVPTGLLISSGPYRDENVFRVAAALEQARGTLKFPGTK